MGLVETLFGLVDVDRAAKDIAALVERRLPIGRCDNRRDVDSALEQAAAAAKGMKRTNGWGLFKCSRLGNRVRWGLLDKGYPAPVADEAGRLCAVAATYAGSKISGEKK